jgi:hypothetical protein
MQTSIRSAELADAGESEASGECHLTGYRPPQKPASNLSTSNTLSSADDHPKQNVASVIV